MVQEVRIPVKADVGHGVSGIGKVEDAFGDAAAAAGGIGKNVGDITLRPVVGPAPSGTAGGPKMSYAPWATPSGGIQ